MGESTWAAVALPALSGGCQLPARTSALESAVKAAVARALESDDITGLIAIVQADPLTTARYLRVVNSPFYGLRQRIGCATLALNVLGRRASAMIALVSSFDYGFSRKRSDRLERVRRHSLRTAVLAHQLAQRSGRAEEAFAAGLLHEIHTMLHSSRDVANQSAGTATDCSLQSAGLLQSWNLPAAMVDAIAELGQALKIGRLPSGELGKVLWVAHQIAHQLDTAGSTAVDMTALATALGIQEAVLNDLVAAAGLRYEAIESRFR
jgi:HD-like signal output (HDOD) protein